MTIGTAMAVTMIPIVPTITTSISEKPRSRLPVREYASLTAITLPIQAEQPRVVVSTRVVALGNRREANERTPSALTKVMQQHLFFELLGEEASIGKSSPNRLRTDVRNIRFRQFQPPTVIAHGFQAHLVFPRAR